MAFRVKGTPEQEVFRDWMKLTTQQREAFDSLRETYAVINSIEESLDKPRPTRQPKQSESDARGLVVSGGQLDGAPAL